MNYLYEPNIASIEKAAGNEELTLKEFFEAWPIAVPIMADRLRKRGYAITSKQLFTMVASPKDSDRLLAGYALKVILYELRNDIDKTLKSMSQ